MCQSGACSQLALALTAALQASRADASARCGCSQIFYHLHALSQAIACALSFGWESLGTRMVIFFSLCARAIIIQLIIIVSTQQMQPVP